LQLKARKTQLIQLSLVYCAFRISAPKIWNSLPANIRDSPSSPTFRRHLKTHSFQIVNLSPPMTTPFPSAP